MMAALHQAMGDIKRRVMVTVGRGVLAAIDDAKKAQEVQIQLLADEVADGVERYQNYGFSSVPFPGAEAVMVCVGGLRSHGIVIAVEDRRYRFTGGQPGEVVMYDDQGQVVHLTRSGIVIDSPIKVTVSSAVEVDVTAPKVVVTANEADIISPVVQLGAAGGKKVALDGDPVVSGKVVASSTKVTAA